MIPSACLRAPLVARRLSLRDLRCTIDNPSIRCRGICLPQPSESPASGRWVRQRDPDTAPESERRSTGGRLSSTTAATGDTRHPGILGTAQAHSCPERSEKTYLTGSRLTSRQAEPSEAAPVVSAYARDISTCRAMSCPQVESYDALREQSPASGASLSYATSDGKCRIAGFWTGYPAH